MTFYDRKIIFCIWSNNVYLYQSIHFPAKDKFDIVDLCVIGEGGRERDRLIDR